MDGERGQPGEAGQQVEDEVEDRHVVRVAAPTRFPLAWGN
jgi:hypothetical protein